MSTTIVVILTGVSACVALLGIEVLLGTRHQHVAAADPAAAEPRLVTPLAARPKLRSLVEHTHRCVVGGFAAAFSLLLVFAAALVADRSLCRSVRAWLAVGTALIAGLVAASRPLLGVHGVSDVVAGLMVGWTWFLLVGVIAGGGLQRFGEPFEDVAAIARDLGDDAHAEVVSRVTSSQHDGGRHGM